MWRERLITSHNHCADWFSHSQTRYWYLVRSTNHYLYIYFERLKFSGLTGWVMILTRSKYVNNATFLQYNHLPGVCCLFWACFEIIFVNIRAEGKLSVLFVMRIVCWLFMKIMTSSRAEWRASLTSVRIIKCPGQILSQYSIIKGYQEEGLI